MRIALSGYGKMGKAIEKEALKKGHEVALKIGAKNYKQLNINNLKSEKADVIIDFSRPETAVQNIKTGIDAGVPVVCGTTGWLNKMEEIKAYTQSQNGTFLYASNFSIGVNLFFTLNKALAKMMNAHPEYQPYLEEIHHTQKLDAPSGTGITLANDLIQEYDNKSNWVKGETTNDKDLSIISKRIDKVPGTHEIEWQSEIDTISIKHTAHSRKGFVMGALLAAEWIQGKKGVFDMTDVLKI